MSGNQKQIIELINKIKNGDEKSQVKLYKYFRKTITHYIKDAYPNNYDVEDDASDILIKVFNNIDNYDSKKSKFNTWVINIAKNHMIDKSRKQKPQLTSFTTTNNADGEWITVDMSDHYRSFTNSSNVWETVTTVGSTSEPVSFYCSPDYEVEMNSSLNYINSNMCSNDFSMINMKNSGYNYKEIGLEFNMTESQVSNKINYAKSKIKKEEE